MTSFMRQLRSLARTYHLSVLVRLEELPFIAPALTGPTLPGIKWHKRVATTQPALCVLKYDQEAGTRAHVHVHDGRDALAG